MDELYNKVYFSVVDSPECQLWIPMEHHKVDPAALTGSRLGSWWAVVSEWPREPFLEALPPSDMAFGIENLSVKLAPSWSRGVEPLVPSWPLELESDADFFQIRTTNFVWIHPEMRHLIKIVVLLGCHNVVPLLCDSFFFKTRPSWNESKIKDFEQYHQWCCGQVQVV